LTTEREHTTTSSHQCDLDLTLSFWQRSTRHGISRSPDVKGAMKVEEYVNFLRGRGFDLSVYDTAAHALMVLEVAGDPDSTVNKKTPNFPPQCEWAS
jgi:hypothetical protein